MNTTTKIIIIIVVIIISIALFVALSFNKPSNVPQPNVPQPNVPQPINNTGSLPQPVRPDPIPPSIIESPFIGFYGSDRGASITKTASGVQVRTGDGRISPATINGNSINVQFVGDPGCCTGTFANNRITWSNGSTWDKY